MRFLVRSWWVPLLLLALVAPGLLPAARASTLTLTVASDPVSIAPGDSLVLQGTVAQSEPHLLGGFGGSMGSFQCDQFDCGQTGFDSAFLTFVNGPPSSALTLYSGPIFNLSILPTATIGYSSLIHWNMVASDANGDFLSTNISYTVNIVPSVPEPSSLLLLGSGLAGFVEMARRRFMR